MTRQDANYKLTPSTSNETSINLPTDISNFLAANSGEITFQLYKSDFVKAMGVISLIPEVYYKKNGYPSATDEIYSSCSYLINIQFGDSATSLYTVNLLKRDDGRHYLNNLKVANGFFIRAFLVEQLSTLIFEKDENGKLYLRIETKLPLETEFVEVQESKESPLYEPLQVIYYGAPGTGKSHTIDDLTDDENSVRTTFHPDSDYASFVGA